MWLRVRDEARSAADSASALQNLALVSRRLGDYTKAQAFGEEAVAVQRTHGFTAMLPRSFNVLGLIAWDVGRFREAAALFDTTIMLAGRVGDEQYLGTGAGNRGLVLMEFGELDSARADLGRQLDAGRRTSNPYMVGTALLNLGTVELWEGDYRRAIAYLDSASVAYGGDSPIDELFLLRLWAFAHDAMGDYRAALVRLDSALVLARAYEKPDEEARNLLAMGDVFAGLGDHRRALELYHQAATLFDELGIEDELAESWVRQAHLHARLGGDARAEEFARRALASHEKADALFSAFDDALLLAELAAKRGDPEGADEMLTRAETFASQARSRGGRAELALTRARVARTFGDDDGVIRAIVSDTATILEGRARDEREAFTLLAEATLHRGRVDESIVFAERAAASADRFERGIGSEDLRSTFRMDKREAYHSLMDALLAAGRHTAAYEAMIRATSVSVGSRRDPTAKSPREAQLVSRLHAIDTSIVNARLFENADAVEVLERERIVVRGEYERVVTTYADGVLRDRDTVSTTPSNNDVVLSLFTSGDHVHVFARASDTIIHLERVVPQAELIERVRFFRDLIADPNTPASLTNALGSWLFNLVLRPVTEVVAVERLYVVPTGALSYVPFSALWDEASQAYAGSVFAIGTLASPSDYRADATPISMTSATLLAPLPEDLQYTRGEIDAINGLIGGVTVVGPSASERVLRQALGEDDVVHVATHGVLNARSPMFSRIEMGRSDFTTGADDGKLEVHEVYGLSIVSQLVFLSGCETGVGAGWATSFGGGEDYRTLADAFLRAGAGAVVATLWSIDDAGGTAFAEAFYTALREEPPARALATAKQAMMLHDRYSHPFYWAGYRITTRRPEVAQNQVATSVSP